MKNFQRDRLHDTCMKTVIVRLDYAGVIDITDLNKLFEKRFPKAFKERHEIHNNEFYMRYKVAVILPVYKNDKVPYVKLSFDSILNQTYKEIHLYIGVDGPVGEELTICLKEYEKDEKVSVQWFSENRGLAIVLNDLLDICFREGYEYIARMDADDISMPDRIARQMTYMLENSDIDVVGGAIEEIDENGESRGKTIVYPLTHEECRKFFRYRDPLAHPATFFRKRYFDKAKGYRPEYRKNQDTMLWFDGFMNGCIFANLPDTVLHFRVSKDFYGRRNGWKRAKQMMRSRMEINKAMKYDITANLFAIAMALMTVSPTWLKKFLYRIR